MDGIARVTVDPFVMEYIMHCMYDTFLRTQKGLRVSISWHREDDTVMLTSTSRPATRDLHLALNRFFVLYNTLRRNLTFEYFQLHEETENKLFIINRIRERYRRIHIQNTNNHGEIKLWGFKSELEESLRYIRDIVDSQERRLQTPEITSTTPTGILTTERSVKQQSKLPKVTRIVRNDFAENDPAPIIFSDSFGRKLSNFKSRRRQQQNTRKTSPPSRYSTSEIRRLQETAVPKKVLTFPKIISQKRRILNASEEVSEVQTPTGLNISACLRETASKDTSGILVTEISSGGRLSDEASWMIAKSRSFEITRIIKLHVSLYGEVTPSRVIVTPGFNLSFTHLIHAVPPGWDALCQKKCQKLLLNTYKNVLRVTDRELNCNSLSIPVLGKCSTAGAVFPENIAFSVLQRAIVSCTKSGFRSLRHIKILCSRRAEFDFVKTTVFTQVLSLKYDPRYLSQQRRFFPENGTDFLQENNENDDFFDLSVEQTTTGV